MRWFRSLFHLIEGIDLRPTLHLSGWRVLSSCRELFSGYVFFILIQKGYFGMREFGVWIWSSLGFLGSVLFLWRTMWIEVPMQERALRANLAVIRIWDRPLVMSFMTLFLADYFWRDNQCLWFLLLKLLNGAVRPFLLVKWWIIGLYTSYMTSLGLWDRVDCLLGSILWWNLTVLLFYFKSVHPQFWIWTMPEQLSVRRVVVPKTSRTCWRPMRMYHSAQGLCMAGL